MSNKKSNNEYYFAELSNGIRVVLKKHLSPILHIGLFINAGSRDENQSKQGLAHFIEHVIFKGTQKRKSYQIFNCIENVGGELNAYTSKEETCIHCSVPVEHLEQTIKLLSEVAFESVFPEKELEKEKDIVIDEYFYYKDIPEEVILDEFDELVFREHPLGWNILGKPDNIKKFTRKDILQFITKNYTQDRMVISVVGNTDIKKLSNVLQKSFGVYSQKTSISKTNRKKYNSYIPVTKEVIKNIHQSHCVLGNIAYSAYDKRKTGLILLNNLLGGPASNSRLNMVVREKHGLTYNIESNYTVYSDTGLFRIYVSTEKIVLEKTIDLIYKVLKEFREKKLGVIQLSKAKKQLIGNIYLSMESKIAEMLSLGKTYLMFNRIDTLKEICSRIEDISAQELQDIANEIFNVDNFSKIIYHSNESYRPQH